MTVTNVTDSGTSDREIVGKRTFNAPRQRVWAAWTEPDQIVRWWGPNGFTTTIHEMDVRPGGYWRFILHGPDGTDYQNECQYTELTPPDRLVYQHLSQPHFQMTAIFTEIGAQTEVTVRMLFESAEVRDRVGEQFGAIEGLQQTLDRMVAHLTTSTNVPAPTLANGKICYLQIPAVDVAQSADFYGKSFGWNLRHRTNGEIAFDDPTGQVSGTWVTGRPPASAPGLLVYIMVDDIESTITAVVQNGGTIVQPVGGDAPEITARFRDPAGNVFGIFQERGVPAG